MPYTPGLQQSLDTINAIRQQLGRPPWSMEEMLAKTSSRTLSSAERAERYPHMREDLRSKTIRAGGSLDVDSLPERDHSTFARERF